MSANDDALKAIAKIADDLMAEEGITRDMLDWVDLDTAYSPVLAFRGEQLGQEVEAIPTMGGRYIVRHPHVLHSVDADSLRLMRLRYLLAYKAEQRRQFGPLLTKLAPAPGGAEKGETQ